MAAGENVEMALWYIIRTKDDVFVQYRVNVADNGFLSISLQ